jgi:hypothetical protein
MQGKPTHECIAPGVHRPAVGHTQPDIDTGNVRQTRAMRDHHRPRQAGRSARQLEKGARLGVHSRHIRIGHRRGPVLVGRDPDARQRFGPAFACLGEETRRRHGEPSVQVLHQPLDLLHLTLGDAESTRRRDGNRQRTAPHGAQPTLEKLPRRRQTYQHRLAGLQAEPAPSRRGSPNRFGDLGKGATLGGAAPRVEEREATIRETAGRPLEGPGHGRGVAISLAHDSVSVRLGHRTLPACRPRTRPPIKGSTTAAPAGAPPRPRRPRRSS